ncbi:MAG TPA: NAD-dependent epimerase/dehydratase family protein [Gaiellaceae bacterium]|nr:NAD-dependent epimerase/dehydratase family protein [Gaiellaceae bacterium]
MTRVVVTGASGNVGTSLLNALAGDGDVTEVVGIARRLPSLAVEKTEWRVADVEHDDLVPLFRGADCVVHLAWRIQPSHDLEALRRTNVGGSMRVFRAVADAGVPALVHASSVGAYSPGPKERRVDESWPTEGTRTSFYARHKAEVERLLDRFEQEQPETRVVRLRPALIFKRQSAEEQRRYFLGPFFPRLLARREAIPLVPDIPGLRFQAVHADDVGEAYRLAVAGDARGAFNVAAEPVLGPQELATSLGARPFRLDPRVARAALAASWRLRLQPTPEGWLDMGLSVPLMDTSRARAELGWEPQRTSVEAILELLEGIAAEAGAPTPPLEPGRKPLHRVS